MASVTLEHVSKRYRDVVAVRDLDLEIADGEFLMLIGPSGCGKTTVLRLIAGLEEPDQGTIRIDGQAVNGVVPGARNVAMVFESFALYPHLVVRRNLDFALRLHRTPPAETDQRVSAVATSMELDRLLERRPAGLAAGEAQHVAIGRALVRDPPSVFLLDDALSHLDARQRIEARAELGRIHRELRTTIDLRDARPGRGARGGDPGRGHGCGRAPAGRCAAFAVRPSRQRLRGRVRRQPGHEPGPDEPRAGWRPADAAGGSVRPSPRRTGWPATPTVRQRRP